MIKLLIDTDAFCKLGMAGFLQDTARIFTLDLQECGRLPALPYMLRKGRLRRLFGALACSDLIPLAVSMTVVPSPSIAWLDKLTMIETIDPGEAQIFAAAGEFGLIVITGDKRALRAVKGVDGFTDALRGHVVVLEAVLLALCDRLGTEHVRQRVAPLALVDRMVEICFSCKNQNPSEALVSYYSELATELSPLIIWNPRN